MFRILKLWVNLSRYWMKLSIILRIIYADQGRRRLKAEANNPLPVVDPWLMLIIYTNFQTETLSYRNLTKVPTMLILFPPIEDPDNSKSLLAFSLVTFHIQTWSPEWPANDSIRKKTSPFLTQNVNYNPYIIQQQQRSLQYFGIFCLFVCFLFFPDVVDR